MARAYGATDCVDVETDARQAILELTGGRDADLVIEASGFPASSAMVLEVVRKEGTVAHIGWAGDLRSLPVIRSWRRP